jgi:hypothetical protein
MNTIREPRKPQPAPGRKLEFELRAGEGLTLEVANRQLKDSVVHLYLLQPLDVVYSRNLPHAVDNLLQVLQVGDFEHHVDYGLSVRAA